MCMLPKIGFPGKQAAQITQIFKGPPFHYKCRGEQTNDKYIFVFFITKIIMLRCYVSVFRKEQRQVRMIAAGETFHSLLGIQEVYSKQQKTKRKSDASNDWYISSTQDGCDEESNRGGGRRRQLLTAMSRSHLQFQANEREIWSKNDPSYHIHNIHTQSVWRTDGRTQTQVGQVVRCSRATCAKPAMRCCRCCDVG